jgi:hypothetical protein
MESKQLAWSDPNLPNPLQRIYPTLSLSGLSKRGVFASRRENGIREDGPLRASILGRKSGF